MSAEVPVAAKAEADVAAAKQARKLKVEAAAAAERRRVAKLEAKWKEPGPLKLPALPGMKVSVFTLALFACLGSCQWPPNPSGAAPGPRDVAVCRRHT
jgi:hypothetical protein